MTYRTRLSMAALSCLLTIANQTYGQQPVDPDLLPPAEFDVQSRGPVHEAFAQPGDLKLEAGIAVPMQPPAPIKEAPPEMRPDNESMQWVPGYWAWDADRQNFTWISGVYREPPPGRRFVPGHWVGEGSSYHWVSGFWSTENQQEISYVPEPPAPLEVKPPTPQPDPNTVFVPGYWVYTSGRYNWRAGYWSPYRAGRIWVAPRYVWTPNGYVFVDGYWDFPLENRGMIFAPVNFAQPVYLQANFVYRPRFVISVGAVSDSLFVTSGSFYFGDYYGPAYVRLGFRPWWDHGYDPLWSYYSWHHRNDAIWVTNMHRVYADRMAGRVALPPRTYAAQLRVGVNIGGIGIAAVVPLKTAVAVGLPGSNFRVVRNERIAIETAHIERMREIEHVRAVSERRAIGVAAPASMRLPPPVIHNVPPHPVAPVVTSTPAIHPQTTPVAPITPHPAGPVVGTPPVHPATTPGTPITPVPHPGVVTPGTPGPGPVGTPATRPGTPLTPGKGPPMPPAKGPPANNNPPNGERPRQPGQSSRLSPGGPSSWMPPAHASAVASVRNSMSPVSHDGERMR
jgi:hypothetical protein